MIVAHRGASKRAPENTLPAFALAWEQGADAIEGDFRLTQDGRIVCIHDETTERVAAKSVRIQEASLDEILAVDVGVRHSAAYAGTVIPTIDQVFATVPAAKKIYVEIKCGPEIIPALLKEINASGLSASQVVVIAFSGAVIQAFKSAAPQYKAFWLSGVKQEESGALTPTLDTVLETLARIKADGFSSHKDGIDAPFIKGVLDAGYEYHVWTVDDKATAKRFKEWGAVSISTNVPDEIIEFFRSEM